MRTTVIWPSADYARDVTRSGDRDRTDLGEPWAESVPPALRRACRDEVARADGRGKIARCTLLRTRRDSHVVCRAQRSIHPRVHQPVLYARGQSARDHVTAQRGEDQRQSLYAREDKVSRADDRSDEVLDESRCVVRRPVLDPSGISDRVEVRAPIVVEVRIERHEAVERVPTTEQEQTRKSTRRTPIAVMERVDRYELEVRESRGDGGRLFVVAAPKP